jgi:hypothetical protein
MRVFAALVMAVTIPCPARSADKGKVNALTAMEVADGWISLFDGQTSFGWKIDGKSTVTNNALVIDADTDASLKTTTRFHAFELRYEIRTAGKPARIELGSSLTTVKANEWTDIWSRRQAGLVLSEVRGNAQFEERMPGRGSGGPTAIRFHISAGSKLYLRNVRLRPLQPRDITRKPAGLEPIFNGKDLTGWKEIPGKKSSFTVTKEGWLNVRNGPGDLQTVSQWDDFVLQLDVICNGKHLNSGVFFRAIPGQFWSGYEAQIRNQWQGHDRTRPVDYGTGGIYNRQPARKVVANDREWFTMTVIAEGKHLATWVNGYQVTDFIDHRPLSNNARKGCKLERGPISLQGHDASTDLSFRNIRMAAYPREVAAP